MTEIIAAFIGVIGSIAVGYLAARDLKRQDRETKKREIRLQFLIKAYRHLESSSNRSPDKIRKYAFRIENAISDVQLCGSRRQIELAQDISEAGAAGETICLDILLDELRRDLRSELELESIPSGRRVMRFVMHKSTTE